MARRSYHAIEEGLIDPRRTIQIGIRSPMHRDIIDWTVGKGVTIVSAEEVHETGPASRRRAHPRGGRRPARLSELSMSMRSTRLSRRAPARPESAGSRPGRRGRSCAGSPASTFAGMDVVEVSPPYDVAEITALAAATMAWEYIALLAPRASAVR